MNMLKRIKLLALRRQTGATATEYAIIVAFIVVALYAIFTAFGTSLGDFFTTVGTKLNGLVG